MFTPMMGRRSLMVDPKTRFKRSIFSRYVSNIESVRCFVTTLQTYFISPCLFFSSDKFCSEVDGIPLWLKQAALQSLDFFVRLENCQKTRPKAAHSDDVPAHLAHISI